MADTRLGEKFAQVVRDDCFRVISEWLKKEHSLDVTVEKLSEIVGVPRGGGPVFPGPRTSSSSLVTNTTKTGRGTRKPKQEVVQNPGNEPDKYEWRYVPLEGTIPCEFVGKRLAYKDYKCGKPCMDGKDGCSKAHCGDKTVVKKSSQPRVQLSDKVLEPINIPGIKSVSSMPELPKDDDLDTDPIDVKINGKTIEYFKERTYGFAINPDNKVEGIFSDDNKEILEMNDKERKIAEDLKLKFA